MESIAAVLEWEARLFRENPAVAIAVYAVWCFAGGVAWGIAREVAGLVVWWMRGG